MYRHLLRSFKRIVHAALGMQSNIIAEKSIENRSGH